MKKASLIFIVIAFVFSIFMLGIFIGRISAPGSMAISVDKGTVPKDISASPSPQMNKININTADVDALCELPNIGPVTAQRILDYREENGPFISIDQIMDVKGIGQATFDTIEEMITVGE